MPNFDHVGLLRDQSVEKWNQWRVENPDAKLDLDGANLRGAKLENANLSRLDLSRASFDEAELFGATFAESKLCYARFVRADLRRVTLIRADLSGADLERATLLSADLGEAILRGTRLYLTSLRRANLARADVTGAYLSGADLRETNLTGANLRDAYLGNVDLFETLFVDVDLSEAKELGHCFHHGPSVVDHRTLARSRDLPEPFARGCGVDDETFDFFRRKAAVSSRYALAFISYSHEDGAFVEKLHAGLQEHGVRCWRDEYKMQQGEAILKQIRKAILASEKLLLCCSRASLGSKWVRKEVELARAREREERRSIILALDLDGAFANWKGPVARSIRTRLAANFKAWDDDRLFDREIKKLVRALTVTTTPKTGASSRRSQA